MTLTSPTAGRRRRASIGAAAAIAALAATLLLPAPAMALTGNVGYQAELHAGFDLSISHARYTFVDGLTPVAAGAPGTEHGPASADDTVAWGMAVAGEMLTATLIANIVEAGSDTAYWVKTRAGTGLFGDPFGECTIYRGDPDMGGVLLDVDEESPYQCSEGTRTSVEGTDPATLYPQKFWLASDSWATIAATVEPVGTITLAGGSLESKMDRFLVDNAPYPSDQAPQPE